MIPLTPNSIGLAILAFVAAVLNGMVGYGFSSFVTPIALFWETNKVLNPALVLVELGVNLTLLFRERGLITSTYHRASPMLLGLAPGVFLGTLGLSRIAPTVVRLSVYGALLPLVILQLFGLWRVFDREGSTGLVVGSGVGFL